MKISAKSPCAPVVTHGLGDLGRERNLNFDLSDSVQVSQITCSAFL